VNRPKLNRFDRFLWAWFWAVWDEWRKEVPWLRGGGDALVGDAVNQPVPVLDAFFFEGV